MLSASQTAGWALWGVWLALFFAGALIRSVGGDVPRRREIVGRSLMLLGMAAFFAYGLVEIP